MPPTVVASGECRFSPAQGIVGHVASTRRPFITGDVASVPFYEDLGTTLTRSELAVPIEVGDDLLGVVNVESQNAYEFDELDVMALEAVAAHVAIALRNAEAHAQLTEQATTDMLTGVSNHRALMEQFDKELDRARRHGHKLAVLFFDLDHFKRTNDTYGHQTGDLVLRQIAGIARASLRTIDTLARYGGEEFVTLLPNTGRAGAYQAAERLRQAVASHIFEGDHQVPLRVTVSVGVASYPDDSTTREALLRRADVALYNAKRLGRNRVCVWGDDHETALAQMVDDETLPVPHAHNTESPLPLYFPSSAS